MRQNKKDTAYRVSAEFNIFSGKSCLSSEYYLSNS